MPLSCDPNETCPCYIETDRAKDEAVRPTFLARFLTRTESRTVFKLINDGVDEQDPETSEALLDAALAIQIVGWKNVADRDGNAVPFRDEAGRPRFDDVMSLGDKWDLARAAIAETVNLSRAKKNSSLSPSGSDTATSVGAAGSSSAVTNPPEMQTP